MKVAVIGAVAAGTSAAAQVRFNDPSAVIHVYDRDEFISYSGCGLPYYIGGVAPDFSSIVPRDAAFFQRKYGIDVFIRHEVLSIDSRSKRLLVKNLADDSIFTDGYDALVIATGASAVRPPIVGINRSNVFSLRTPSDAHAIAQFLADHKPRRAAIIGSGYVGLEMAESFVKRGLSVTVIEKMPTVCPALDEDVSAKVQQALQSQGVTVLTGRNAAGIGADSVLLESGESIPADLVLVSVGVVPNVALAKETGVTLGTTGAIAVDERMHTSLPDIYACGDCIECKSVVDGRALFRPLGSTANKTGWVAGSAISGADLTFAPIAGTSIFKLFDFAVALTGLTEREARASGYDVAAASVARPDKSAVFGGGALFLKAVANRKSGKLLGLQAVGTSGVDKRIDIFATTLSAGLTVDDLFKLDLSYAPPFSTAKDPLHYLALALRAVF